MRILITGASGFIGSAIMDCFRKKNEVKIIPVFRGDGVSKIEKQKLSDFCF